MAKLMKTNMAYLGISKFEEGGHGWNGEAVRSFAVDGGCVPSLTVRDGSVTLRCKRRGGLQALRTLGFQVEVLYRNLLYCNAHSVETALQTACWDSPNRLWRCNGAGSYLNRPHQIQEQLKNAVISTVFIVYAPLTLRHRFLFARNLPLYAAE